MIHSISHPHRLSATKINKRRSQTPHTQPKERREKKMRLLSANKLISHRPLFSPFTHPSITPQNNTRHPSSLKPPSQTKLSLISASLSSPTTTTVTIVETPQPPADWAEFAKRVSGEWDGFGADFTPAGSPVELPENVVPDAYREWEVEVFDWQTQCPTLASEAGDPALSYKLIKLLPTVGCEADAATRHSVDERTAGGPGNVASAMGYRSDGCYVGVWPVEGRGLEVESCLVDPGNGGVRVRVVVAMEVEGDGLKMGGVRVFSEQWYGPWRNGEQLGGCAIRESGFAQSERVKVEDVVGVWEGTRLSVARFGSETKVSESKDVIYGLTDDRPERSTRDREGLVALPKNLWCSSKEKENGETWGEVGWLLDRGVAMISRCVFDKNGALKEMAIREEAAVLEDK